MHGENKQEFNAQVIKPLLQYVSDVYGPEALARVSGAADLSSERLLNEKHQWISAGQFDRLTAAARQILADDQEFKRACSYKMVEAIGSMIYLLRAASPRLVYQTLARTMPVASKVSSYEVVEAGRRHVRMLYRTTVTETRLICLSRQATLGAAPAMWKLPEATLIETKCVCWGDDCCEYHISWHPELRVAKLLLVGAAAGLGGYALFAAGVLSAFPAIMFCIIGLLLGGVVEQHRQRGEALVFSQESRGVFEKLYKEYTGANTEVLDLNERLQQWNRILEQKVEDRTETLQGIAHQLGRLRERDRSALRSVSHDLRNPLTTIRLTVMTLLQESTEGLELDKSLLVGLEDAVGSLDAMLRDLINFASSDEMLLEVVPESLEVSSLGPKLKRRLDALCLGRDIRCSSFKTREAPDYLETDVLLFDRIVDNLLTNAAKYTERGSIILEISGTPGFLCLKLSDTGRGLSVQRLEEVLTDQSAPPDQPTVDESHGLGLAIVVRLMSQLGGRLEVMSKPDFGTTFWAYFPVSLGNINDRQNDPYDEPIRDVMRRVLTVRAFHN